MDYDDTGIQRLIQEASTVYGSDPHATGGFQQEGYGQSTYHQQQLGYTFYGQTDMYGMKLNQDYSMENQQGIGGQGDRAGQGSRGRGGLPGRGTRGRGATYGRGSAIIQMSHRGGQAYVDNNQFIGADLGNTVGNSAEPENPPPLPDATEPLPAQPPPLPPPEPEASLRPPLPPSSPPSNQPPSLLTIDPMKVRNVGQPQRRGHQPQTGMNPNIHSDQGQHNRYKPQKIRSATPKEQFDAQPSLRFAAAGKPPFSLSQVTSKPTSQKRPPQQPTKIPLQQHPEKRPLQQPGTGALAQPGAKASQQTFYHPPPSISQQSLPPKPPEQQPRLIRQQPEKCPPQQQQPEKKLQQQPIADTQTFKNLYNRPPPPPPHEILNQSHPLIGQEDDGFHFCELCCEVTPQTWNTHQNSDKHLKRLEIHQRTQVWIAAESENDMEVNEPSTRVDISNCTEPLIGLEYVIERKVPKENNVICKICYVVMVGGALVPHLVGLKHRFVYIKKHHPQFINRFYSVCKHSKLSFEESRKMQTQFLLNTAKMIEATNGRAKVKVVMPMGPSGQQTQGQEWIENDMQFNEPSTLVNRNCTEPLIDQEWRVGESTEIDNYMELDEPFTCTEPLIDQEWRVGDNYMELDEPFTSVDLSNCTEPLIGMEYIVERKSGQKNNIRCKICDVLMSGSDLIQHLLGIRHRFAYLKKHYPKFAQAFRLLCKQSHPELTFKQSRKSQTELLRKKAKIIENVNGRGKIQVVVAVQSVQQTQGKKKNKPPTAMEHIQSNFGKASDTRDMACHGNQLQNSGIDRPLHPDDTRDMQRDPYYDLQDHPRGPYNEEFVPDHPMYQYREDLQYGRPTDPYLDYLGGGQSGAGIPRVGLYSRDDYLYDLRKYYPGLRDYPRGLHDYPRGFYDYPQGFYDGHIRGRPSPYPYDHDVPRDLYTESLIRDLLRSRHREEQYERIHVLYESRDRSSRSLRDPERLLAHATNTRDLVARHRECPPDDSEPPMKRSTSDQIEKNTEEQLEDEVSLALAQALSKHKR